MKRTWYSHRITKRNQFDYVIFERQYKIDYDDLKGPSLLQKDEISIGCAVLVIIG